MKQYLKYFLAIITGLILMSGFSQGQNVVRLKNNIPVASGLPNLKPGDILPDFEIVKVIRSDRRTMNTADFKDRLLIIDFWATGCSGCVAALPKMGELQKQFGNSVKILPVTYEKENFVVNFWNRVKYIKDVQLSSVVEDSVFRAYFLHDAIPHEVWVYKGKVIAITDASYVDSLHIQKVLNGERINWPVKNDFIVFDKTQPLFTPDNNQIDSSHSFLYYEAISGYREGVNATGLSGGRGVVRDKIKKTVRAFLLNEAIYTSYFLSRDYLPGNTDLIKPSPSHTIGPNEIAWEVKDPGKYFFDSEKAYQADWMRKYGICFESVAPDSGQTDKQVYQSVIKDMDRLLGLHVRWEKRKEKVLVLVRTSKLDKIKSKGPLKKNEAAADELSPIGYLRNVSLSNLVYNLNKQSSNPYVFDETNYKGLVDMKLNISSWTDIDLLRKELKVYGLDLKETEREVSKLVFSEVNGGLLVDKQ